MLSPTLPVMPVPAGKPPDPDCLRTLTRKDFQTEQEVRWCPGCGDYAILATVQKVLAGLGIPRHQFVFVSGIGCSSRIPAYTNCYGFHGVHGRSLALAAGVAPPLGVSLHATSARVASVATVATRAPRAPSGRSR